MLPSKDVLERIKAVFSLIVGLVVFGTVAVTMVSPGTVIPPFIKSFEAASVKFTKGSLGPLQFEIVRSEVKEADGLLAQALAGVGTLTAGEGAGAAPPAALREVERNIHLALKSLGDTQNALVPEAGPAGETEVRDPAGQPSVIAGDSWLAVLGADRDLASAKHEVNKIGHGARLLKVGNFYRTVVVFDSESAANAALPGLSRAAKRQGYVRRFAAWCPAPLDKGDFIDCG